MTPCQSPGGASSVFTLPPSLLTQQGVVCQFPATQSDRRLAVPCEDTVTVYSREAEGKDVRLSGRGHTPYIHCTGI